jgi:hypothetical protein
LPRMASRVSRCLRRPGPRVRPMRYASRRSDAAVRPYRCAAQGSSREEEERVSSPRPPQRPVMS